MAALPELIRVRIEPAGDSRNGIASLDDVINGFVDEGSHGGADAAFANCLDPLGIETTINVLDQTVQRRGVAARCRELLARSSVVRNRHAVRREEVEPPGFHREERIVGKLVLQYGLRRILRLELVARCDPDENHSIVGGNEQTIRGSVVV